MRISKSPCNFSFYSYLVFFTLYKRNQSIGMILKILQAPLSCVTEKKRHISHQPSHILQLGEKNHKHTQIYSNPLLKVETNSSQHHSRLQGLSVSDLQTVWQRKDQMCYILSKLKQIPNHFLATAQSNGFRIKVQI